MKKGFTLLEIIIVIIIIGVLATLGFTQYAKMVERSRGAEARAICGDIRKFASAYRLEQGTTAAIGPNDVNIGVGNDQIPSACRSSHYFSYQVATGAAGNGVTITATRCGAAGKTPGGGPSAGQTYIITSDLVTGTDTVAGTGNY